jgi:hypothetical protein
MNCKNCNALLQPQTRFCAVCGTPVQGNTRVSATDQTMPASPMWPRPMDATTPQQPIVINPQSLSRQASPYPLEEPQSTFAPTMSLPDNRQLERGKRVPRRRPGGCLFRLTLVLVLLFAALAGGWFFVLQPTVHAIVINKLDTAMAQAVDRIPPLPQRPSLPLPFHPPSNINVTIPIPNVVLENFLETTLKSNMGPSDPVRDPVVHINQQGMRLDFNVQPDFLPFGLPCAVSFLPVIDAQGNLVAQNVNIEGVAGLAISSDELTGLLNKHFADALSKLNHPISKIDFTEREVDVTLK